MPEKTPGGRRFTHEDYSAELIRHEMVDVIDDHKDNQNIIDKQGFVKI